MGGAANEEEAQQKYELLKEIFLAAGFELKKWRSNNPRVQKFVDHRESEFSPGEPPLEHNAVHNALGVEWNTEEDYFQISTAHAYTKGKEMKTTKRNILKVAASIYDPIGVHCTCYDIV